jgi:hypothetical protein
MGHGTHVAGTIGAVRDQRGLVGVAAEKARIYVYGMFDAAGNASLSDVAIATESCDEELERLEASINPDMKMVVVVSAGAMGMPDKWEGDFYDSKYARGVRPQAGCKCWLHATRGGACLPQAVRLLLLQAISCSLLLLETRATAACTSQLATHPSWPLLRQTMQTPGHISPRRTLTSNWLHLGWVLLARWASDCCQPVRKHACLQITMPSWSCSWQAAAAAYLYGLTSCPRPGGCLLDPLLLRRYYTAAWYAVATGHSINIAAHQR